MLVEIQALVGETSYGTPQRLAANVDRSRLAMILAVSNGAPDCTWARSTFTHRRRNLASSSRQPISASLSRSLRLFEAFRCPPRRRPSANSAFRVKFAPVAQRARRIAEARKLGFETIVTPPGPPGERDGATAEYADIARAIAAVLG